MKKHIKSITLLITLILLNSLGFSQSQTVSYNYDTKGNRISRAIIVLPAQVDKNFDITELEVEEELEECKIHIFPNPTKGELKVVITGHEQELYEQSILSVYTMSGALVQQIAPVQETNYLNLINQKPGIYILRLVIGGKVESWKIVKQ